MDSPDRQAQAPDDGASSNGTGRRRRTAMTVLGAAFAGALLASGLWSRCGLQGCPNVARLAAYGPEGATVLLDRDGRAFAHLRPVERRLARLGTLPDFVPDAFLASEDRRFFEHRGVDWRRVAGAAVANLRAGRVRQGSSTITMQLARNVFQDRIPGTERTWRRKLLEMRVARAIERHYTKSEILELYVNHIYFGNGAWGIESAAWHYFGKVAARLTLEEAALLAAIPKAPAHYDPRSRPERARARRDLVLQLMTRQGRITVAEAERARARPVRTRRSRDAGASARAEAPWFAQYVRAQLEARLGDRLFVRPLRVHTTIDRAAQAALEEELERQIRRVAAGAGGGGSLQGAGVVMDAVSGDIRAMVGGRAGSPPGFNRAVAARRQVGSAFKPFVAAAALRKGWTVEDRLEDSPYRLVAADGSVWEPANFDGRFGGPVTLRETLVLSRNVPAVRLAEAVGTEDVARIARAAGLRGSMPGTPVIALGVTESNPLELTAAYSAFANDGRRAEPRAILCVEDADGRVLWAPRVARRRVVSAGVARGVSALLHEAVDRGTGRGARRAGYHGPAAGKTGTTNAGADAWFVGYTPDRVAGVWFGFDRLQPIAPGVTGGTAAAEAWGRVMRRIAEHGAWPDAGESRRSGTDGTGLSPGDGAAGPDPRQEHPPPAAQRPTPQHARRPHAAAAPQLQVLLGEHEAALRAIVRGVVDRTDAAVATAAARALKDPGLHARLDRIRQGLADGLEREMRRALTEPEVGERAPRERAARRR
jgi:1A family penicillin-binding protein